MSIKVQGWDLSLNHSGFVEFIDGEFSNFWYLTIKAGSANRSKNGHRLFLSKTKDKQILCVKRLADIADFLLKYPLASKPDFVGIEDYALRAEQGAHQLGEAGGVARFLCWLKKIKLRLHDPMSVKMFATHDGTVRSKDYVEEAVKERWEFDFSKYNQPLPNPTNKKPNPKQDRTTSEDLADAFAIAKLVWIEVQLRTGKILMSDLHEKEIQVFNRITKTYPVSLLGREWIHREG